MRSLIYAILSGVLFAVILLLLFPALRPEGLSHWGSVLMKEQPMSYNEAVKKASPAVVNLYNDESLYNSSMNQLTALGSGVIMTEDGYIVTNFHVVNNASFIVVALQDGRTFNASLVGTDRVVDIAVLKIEANDLPIITYNPSRVPKVGDVVLAIGNPYNIGQTITQGIISATGRDGLSAFRRQNFIQTDASINLGNSGGALINSLGELVGINTLTFSKTENHDIPEGIGFAIPVSLVVKIMNALIVDGEVVRGYIGIDGVEYRSAQSQGSHQPQVTGILVTSVDGPAKIAGIQANDILVEVDGKPVSSIVETVNQIAELEPGEVISVVYWHEGKKEMVNLMIEQLIY